MDMDARSRRDADFEIARLDAAKTDWSVYAHHPNTYVRGLALLRLRDGGVPVATGQLARVAQLLGDASPLYSAECARLLLSCEQGQGLDMMRGNCVQQALTVGAIADDIMAAAEPKSIVVVMVSNLSSPSVSDGTGMRFDMNKSESRLRVSAEKAPEAFMAAIADALAKGNPLARLRLLNALTLAPLGSGDPRTLALVVPSLQSKDVVESATAAAAILRLTDRPGLVAASTSDEPRKSALATLLTHYAAQKTSLLRLNLGPAASPLLDAVMAQLRRHVTEGKGTSYHLDEVKLLEEIGPRAKRASSLLVEFGSQLDDGGSRQVFERANLIRTLAAIDAPAAELTQFALSHITSREEFAAAASGLVAAKVSLSPEELTRLKSYAGYCKIPNHPRAFDGSWDECFQANSDVETLERRYHDEPTQSEESKGSNSQ